MSSSSLKSLFQDKLLIALLAIVWLVQLVPIWGVRFLPLLDFPNHLGAMAILHRFHDPSWHYDQFYTLNLKPLPYWGHYFPVHLLAYVMPLETANKVWLSAYALSLPLGVAALAKQLGRSPYLALLAAPFVFSFCFALGFLSFCGGAALFPWALYTLERFLDEPTPLKGLALALLSSSLYLMHVMPFVLFGIFAGVVLLSRGWQPRRIGAAAGCMLVAVALALAGALAQRSGHFASEGGPGQKGFAARFEPFRVAWRGLGDRWLTGVPDHAAAIAMIVLALSWLGLVVTSRRSSSTENGFRFRYDLMLLASVMLYFLLPQTLYRPLSWWYIAGRMTVFIALLAALAPRGDLDLRSGARRFLLVPALLVSIAYPIDLYAHWRRFDRRAEPFARLMQQVPRGSSTLVLMLGRNDDPDVDANSVPFLEFHSLAQVLAGGFDPWAQATPLGGFPMVPIAERVLPAPYFSRPGDFNMERHGVHYDYLVTRNEARDYGLVPQTGADLLGTDGAYRLYRVRK